MPVSHTTLTFARVIVLLPVACKLWVNSLSFSDTKNPDKELSLLVHKNILCINTTHCVLGKAYTSKTKKCIKVLESQVYINCKERHHSFTTEFAYIWCPTWDWIAKQNGWQLKVGKMYVVDYVTKQEVSSLPPYNNQRVIDYHNYVL